MEYVIFRIDRTQASKGRLATTRLAKSSDWYPRVVEADSHEEAVESMFMNDTGELRVSGHRSFLVVPLEGAREVEARPKPTYELQSKRYEGYNSL